MALTAAANFGATPATLTITSDKRLLATGTVSVAGETAPYFAYRPVVITETVTGRVWTLLTDNGAVAVYTTTP